MKFLTYIFQGVTGNQSVAGKAVLIADNTSEGGGDFVTQEQFEVVETQVTTNTNDIGQLQTTVGTNVDDIADLQGVTADLSSQVSTAQSTANNAQSTADTANTTANTAQSTANTANTTANNAQSSAASNASAILNRQEFPVHITGNSISFNTPRIYGYYNAPISGALTLSATGAKAITQKIYYNDTALPSALTPSATVKKVGGNFVSGVLNIIYINYDTNAALDTNYFTYWIVQP